MRTKLFGGLLALLFGGSAAMAGTVATFDGPGDTNYTLEQNNSAPGPAIQAGGPTGNYLHLLSTVGNQQNSIAFDSTFTQLQLDGAGGVFGSFDFRGTGGTGGADGFAMAFIPVSTYGNTGTGATPAMLSEEANLANAFGIGFDVYSNGPETNNHVSVHYNGSQAGPNQDLNPATQIELNDGNFHRAVFTLRETGNQVYLDLSLINDVYGTADEVVVYSNFLVPGYTSVDEFRLQLRGRTGGVNMNLDLDNINLQLIPEPASIAVWGMLGMAGVVYARRRQRGQRNA